MVSTEAPDKLTLFLNPLVRGHDMLFGLLKFVHSTLNDTLRKTFLSPFIFATPGWLPLPISRICPRSSAPSPLWRKPPASGRGARGRDSAPPRRHRPTEQPIAMAHHLPLDGAQDRQKVLCQITIRRSDRYDSLLLIYANASLY